MNYRSLEVLRAVKNGFNTRQQLIEVIPRATVDNVLKNLTSDNLLEKAINNKEAYFSLTPKGRIELQKAKDFSKIQITRKPNELLEMFRAELINQVILPEKTLQEMIMTVPFCYGRIGRQYASITSYFISASGRGKSIIMDIYQDLFENPSYLDCKDIFGNKGIETRFANVVKNNPDMAIFEEVSSIYGSKLTSLQSHLNSHIFPVVFTGNPSSSKADYKIDTFHGWLQFMYMSGKHNARSFIDRINLFIYLPKLQPRKERELIDIFFDENMIDLSEVGAYIKQQKAKNPNISNDSRKRFIEIRDKVRYFVEHEKFIDTKIIDPDGVMQKIDITEFTGGENMARFEISLMILARGMALRDDSPDIKPEYFETAFDWYFYFLDQIYKIKMRKKVGL